MFVYRPECVVPLCDSVLPSHPGRPAGAEVNLLHCLSAHSGPVSLSPIYSLTHSLTHYALLVYHNNNYLNLHLTLPVPLLNVLFVLFRLTVSIMWNSLTHRNLLICCFSVICRHMVILTCLQPSLPPRHYVLHYIL